MWSVSKCLNHWGITIVISDYWLWLIWLSAIIIAGIVIMMTTLLIMIMNIPLLPWLWLWLPWLWHYKNLFWSWWIFSCPHLDGNKKSFSIDEVTGVLRNLEVMVRNRFQFYWSRSSSIASFWTWYFYLPHKWLFWMFKYSQSSFSSPTDISKILKSRGGGR